MQLSSGGASQRNTQKLSETPKNRSIVPLLTLVFKRWKFHLSFHFNQGCIGLFASSISPLMLSTCCQSTEIIENRNNWIIPLSSWLYCGCVGLFASSISLKPLMLSTLGGDQQRRPLISSASVNIRRRVAFIFMALLFAALVLKIVIKIACGRMGQVDIVNCF